MRADDEATVPRERLRLSAAAYATRGGEFASRPRPEDQDEALRLFRKALALDPDLAAAHAGMARVSTYLYSLGIDATRPRITTALDQARKAVELAPQEASTHAVLAMALAADDRLTPALDEARRATALDPRSAEAQVALGVILRLRRQIDESLDACHHAAESDPASPRVLVALAESLREAGRYGEAMEMYGQAIDLDHEAIVPQLGAAATWQKGGNLELARRLYRLLLDKWDYAEDRTRLGLASLLIASEEFEQAIGVYEQIEVPRDASMPAILALYGKGYALLRLGRDAEAEYFLSTLVDRVPRDYDGPARGRELLFRAYADLADYFAKRGRERKVEALLRAACERPLVPTRLARRLADHLASRGENDEAGALLARAIRASDPLEDPLDLTETAVALARFSSGGGRRRLDPDSPEAGALRLCSERIHASPLGVVHFRLARAQALVRDTAAALASLELAKKNGYLPVDAVASDSDFDLVRKDPGFEALLH